MQVKAAVYCRISQDRRKDEEGVDRQEEHCRARAEREGWSVIRVWTDNDLGASTKSRKVRPAYRELLAAAERGEIDVILSYSTSRLTRRPLELEALISLHERTGVTIRTIVSGDTDLNTADGRAVARTLAAWDAAEAERTAERVGDAARQRAVRGKAHGGRRPFGFHADGTAHEDEGLALRAAILDVTAGTSIREVARRWDEAGLTTASGRLWAADLTGVRQVLTRWRNAGYRVHHGAPLLDADKPYCTPIVSPAELAELHAVLADRKRRANRGRTARVALMGGIARCGVCGNVLQSATHGGGNSGQTRADTYRCAGLNGGHINVRRHVVDEAVELEVVAALLADDLTASISSADDRARIEAVRAEMARIEAGTTELTRAMREGVLTLAEVRDDLAHNRTRRAALEQELLGLSGRVAVAGFVVRTRDWMTITDESLAGVEGADAEADAEADAVLARFTGMDLERRRELVRSLLDVVVNPGRGPGRVVVTRRHAT